MNSSMFLGSGRNEFLKIIFSNLAFAALLLKKLLKIFVTFIGSDIDSLQWVRLLTTKVDDLFIEI